MTSSSPSADPLVAAVPLLREAAEAVGDARASRAVRAVESYLSQVKLRLLIVGATGSGRATLVDALLGQPDLLPRSPLPKAPLPLIIRFGADLTVEVTNAQGISTAIPASDLRSLIYRPETAYREVGLHAPAELLKTCDIRIDSLETFRSPDEWDDLVWSADFTVVLLRAPALLSVAERELIREHLVQRGLERVALLINQMDLVDEGEHASVLDAVSRFLGPFDRQPVILDISASEALQGGSDAEALERLMRDVVGRREELRLAGLRTLLDSALDELAQGAARQDALLAMDADRIQQVQSTLSGRGEWLEERIDRMHHRVSAFIGTLLGGSTRHDIQEFGALFRRRLPAEIEAVDDMATVRRYLPGYIEHVWRELLRNEAITMRRAVEDEVVQIDTMIQSDLQGLLGDDIALESLITEIDPASDTPDSFVMPRRGAHFASSIAKGLSYQGLILTIWSLPLGLASLGAGHLVRRLYRSGIQEAERKAYVEAATTASREFEEEVLRRLDDDNHTMINELRAGVESAYRDAAERIESFLKGHALQERDITAQRDEIARVRGHVIPEIRAQLDSLEVSAQR